MKALYCFMKLCMGLLLFTVISRAQLQNEPASLKVTLCDLYKEPQEYAGKMVEFRATIVGSVTDHRIERPAFSPQEPCQASGYMSIALEWPQNVKPEPDFDLERDSSFLQYKEALGRPVRIEATLNGRFDPVFVWQNRKRVRVGEGKGFGKGHTADARLVLRKTSDIRTWRIPRR